MFWKRTHADDRYDEYYAERPPRTVQEFAPLWVHLGVLALIAVAALLAVWGVAGWTMVERFLKQLVAPVGLVWIGLGLMTYFALVRRMPWIALAGLTLWLLLTAGGNRWVRQTVVASLERDHLQTHWSQLGEFDVVLVLGGGTDAAPNGSPMLVASGDRVVTAARMFHQGQIKFLVAAGSQALRARADELDRCQEMCAIWNDLGIPDEAMGMVRGINTREELEAFAAWLATKRQSQDAPTLGRLGILSSAWHLPRAMKLCRALQIDATAIPCDYWTRRDHPDPSLIVPSAENLTTVTKVLFEYLGAGIGR